ncbi:hypothetical protein ACFV9C_42050 [Kribbella sp. NPDC059898]|uniref:hypothetical protein n=1 Tax=Kribbella sp. NPDC059898 TaxID=3346995 RepID=UPI0036628A23
MTTINEEEVRRECERQLADIFAYVDKVQALLDGPQSRFAVKAGSALAGDDKKSDPYHVSHDAGRLIGVGYQHLHALGCLLRSGALHTSPPFTLVRAAIETGSMAYWLLEPRRRPARVLRRLQLARQDVYDGDTAATQAGIPVNRSREDRLKDLEAIALRVCGSDKIPGLRPSEIVKEVEGKLPERHERRQFLAWQACSGFTHGRLWPEVSLLKRELISQNGDVQTLRMTNDLTRVWWVTRAASGVLDAAVGMFDERNQGS